MLTKISFPHKTRHVSATALVMFPKLWFLGPLRWWIPWKFQASFTTVGTWMGLKPLRSKYMSKDEWEDVEVQKRVGTVKTKDW